MAGEELRHCRDPLSFHFFKQDGFTSNYKAATSWSDGQKVRWSDGQDYVNRLVMRQNGHAILQYEDEFHLCMSESTAHSGR